MLAGQGGVRDWRDVGWLVSGSLDVVCDIIIPTTQSYEWWAFQHSHMEQCQRGVGDWGHKEIWSLVWTLAIESKQLHLCVAIIANKPPTSKHPSRLWSVKELARVCLVLHLCILKMTGQSFRTWNILSFCQQSLKVLAREGFHLAAMAKLELCLGEHSVD